MLNILTLTLNPALDVSARTPQVVPTRKLRCDTVERHPGGGGVNVARVLHRFGADVQALYTSGGTTGQLLTELLQQEGVPCLPIDIPGHTRESFTVLDAQSGQEYRFVLPGPDLGAEQLAALVQAVGTARPSWLVASGSLSPGVPDDFYAQLAHQVAAWGGRIVVDTAGAALRAALEAGVAVAKPSLREFRDLVGDPLAEWDALADAARYWVLQGKAQMLAVSMGEQGALMATRDRLLYAPPLAVPVHSAVGAGDSFVAGLVQALSKGQPIDEAFRLAVACGSAALAHQGTGLSALPEIDRLLPQVVCTQKIPCGRI